MSNIGNLDIQLDLSLYLFIRRDNEFKLVTLNFNYFFHLFYLDLNNSFDEGSYVILGQMVNIIVPIAHCTLLLPRSQLAWIVTSEVSHEDVKA